MVELEQPQPVTTSPIRAARGDWRGDARSLIAEVGPSSFEVMPFDALTVDLCSALSERLMHLRRHPAAVAVGFWMRPAAVASMRAGFEASVPEGQVAVPRGLAFHVTPANVDTLFMYSWVLSLLAGNANIVRLSSRSTDIRMAMLEAVGEALDGPGMSGLARRNRFILTDHDEVTMGVLSAASDIRVVWGGDATVERLRRFPIPVRGRDVVFPDRHSLAILDAPSVAALDERGLRALAGRFFDDAFWFDQAACSSPRLLLWRAGDRTDETEQAIGRFHAAVIGLTRRRSYEVETGIVLNKMAFATDVAARFDGVRVDSQANEATWVRLRSIADYDRENCGGGLFFEVVSDDVEKDLLALVGPRDQTVTTFGMTRASLLGLAQRLNGRGVDRFVPVGRALAFDQTWDGIDLLREFSRRVVVEA